MLFSTFSTKNRIMPLGFLQGLFFKLSVPPTSLTTVRTEPAARGSATARGAGRAPRSQALKALEILVGSESSVADAGFLNETVQKFSQVAKQVDLRSPEAKVCIGAQGELGSEIFLLHRDAGKNLCPPGLGWKFNSSPPLPYQTNRLPVT